jgi:hypothetical protein
VDWFAASKNPKVQVLRFMVAPVPVPKAGAGSFIKLCPPLEKEPLALFTMLPIVGLSAVAGLEMARVLTRRAVTPHFFD